MLNSAAIMGRLTADPVLKTAQSGKEFCRFTVAVDRSYTKGEQKTDFINALAFDSSARFVCNYFKKGQMIALEGAIRTDSYTDSQGVKRNTFEIVAREVSFCGGNPSTTSGSPSLSGTAGKQAAGEQYTYEGGFSTATPADFEEITDDEDLPF